MLLFSLAVGLSGRSRLFGSAEPSVEFRTNAFRRHWVAVHCGRNDAVQWSTWHVHQELGSDGGTAQAGIYLFIYLFIYYV